MEGTSIGMAGRKTAAILFTVTFLITSIFTGCGEKAERIAEIRLDYDSFDFAGVEGLSQISPDAVIPEYCSEVSIGYTQEDGTNKLLLFSQPVQYMNSSGSLEPIDTRIKNADPSEERKGYIYQTASCDINVYYPEDLSQGSGIKLCSEKYEYELRLTRDREKPVLEDKISLILDEKPRHTAVCLRFSPASQKNFLSYKTALHLKTSCFYVRMCPKREAILTYCKL